MSKQDKDELDVKIFVTDGSLSEEEISQMSLEELARVAHSPTESETEELRRAIINGEVDVSDEVRDQMMEDGFTVEEAMAYILKKVRGLQ